MTNITIFCKDPFLPTYLKTKITYLFYEKN